VEALAKADIVLAARAAREAGDPGLAEASVVRAARKARLDFDISTVLCAMRIARTPRLLQILRAHAAKEQEEGCPAQATRELMLLGDRATVELAADQRDDDTWSGFEVTDTYSRTWNRVPPAVRRTVVRERLATHPRCIGNSLRTLVGLGSRADVPLMVEAIRATRDATMWAFGALALHELDSDAARSLLQELWAQPGFAHRAVAVEAFVEAGEPFDATPLIHHFLELAGRDLPNPTRVWAPSPELQEETKDLSPEARSARYQLAFEAEYPPIEGPTVNDLAALGRALCKAVLTAAHWSALEALRDRGERLGPCLVWGAAAAHRHGAWTADAIASVSTNSGCTTGASEFLEAVDVPDELCASFAAAVEALRGRTVRRWFVTRTLAALAVKALGVPVAEAWVREAVGLAMAAWRAGEADKYQLEAVLGALPLVPGAIGPEVMATLVEGGFESSSVQVNEAIRSILGRCTEEEFDVLVALSPPAAHRDPSAWLLDRSQDLPWWSSRRRLAARVAAQLFTAAGVSRSLRRCLEARSHHGVVEDVVRALSKLRSPDHPDGNRIDPSTFVSDLVPVLVAELDRTDAEGWMKVVVDQTEDDLVRALLESLRRGVARVPARGRAKVSAGEAGG
jgi:hypothetical protein